MKHFIVALCILLMVVVLSFVLLHNMERQLTVNAKVLITAKVMDIINDSISEATNLYDEKEIVTYTNQDGTIYVQTDYLLLNQLSSKACELVQERIGDLCSIGVSLPLGSALGNNLFSSFGPRVKVTVSLSGNVNGSFSGDFESAGINQTLHRVMLTISTNMTMLLSSGASTFTVSNVVTIYEGIIVGKVPQYYFSSPSAMFDLVP